MNSEKIYRIKVKEYILYVKGIVFDVVPDKNEVLLKPMLTDEITEAGWYEEDKANKYCEELNKQSNGDLFSLEEVKRG